MPEAEQVMAAVTAVQAEGMVPGTVPPVQAADGVGVLLPEAEREVRKIWKTGK